MGATSWGMTRLLDSVRTALHQRRRNIRCKRKMIQVLHIVNDEDTVTHDDARPS